MERKNLKTYVIDPQNIRRAIGVNVVVGAVALGAYGADAAKPLLKPRLALTSEAYQDSPASVAAISRDQAFKLAASRSLQRTTLVKIAAKPTAVATTKRPAATAPSSAATASEAPANPAIKTYAFNAQQLSWLAIRAQCESGNDPTIDTGNGYFGLFQYDRPSFLAVATVIRGTYQRADQAPAIIQEEAIAYTTDHEGGNNHAEHGCNAKAEATGTAIQAQEVLPDDAAFLAFFGLPAHSAQLDHLG